MAVGLFGGSFDPIHFGHLITTQAVLEKRELDKIIFMPSFISPLKRNRHPVSDFHRLAMVKLAIESNPKFCISDFEIKRGGVSFTYETLLELKILYDEIELIIGFDNLLVFDKWHKPDEIFDLVKVVVLKRKSEQAEEASNKYFSKAILVDTPTIDISSTDIRNRIKNNLTIEYLVPQKVKEYISNNALYK